MNFSDLETIVERNDSAISFEGAGFFMSKKFGLLGKKFQSIPDKMLIQEALRTIRNFNLTAYNVICDTTCDPFCVNVDGEEINVRRTEHYTGKFGDKLRFTQCDYNDDTDELISCRTIFKDYDLKDNCIINEASLNKLISKF